MSCALHFVVTYACSDLSTQRLITLTYFNHQNSKCEKTSSNVCTSENAPKTQLTESIYVYIFRENAEYLQLRVSSSSRVLFLLSNVGEVVPGFQLHFVAAILQHFIVIFKVGQSAFFSNQVVPGDLYLQSACATSPLESTGGSLCNKHTIRHIICILTNII